MKRFPSANQNESIRSKRCFRLIFVFKITKNFKETYLVPEAESFILVHLIHAGFEFPIRFYRHDRQRLEVVETDGGAIEKIQVDDLIVGIGETFVVKVPVTWEGEILLRAELMVECQVLHQIEALSLNFLTFLAFDFSTIILKI